MKRAEECRRSHLEVELSWVRGFGSQATFEHRPTPRPGFNRSDVDEAILSRLEDGRDGGVSLVDLQPG